MAATLPVFAHVSRRRIQWRLAAFTTFCLAVAAALGWPLMVAVPVIGGPLAALAAGTIGWRLASAAAPPPHANDNVPARPGRADTTEQFALNGALAAESPLHLVDARGSSAA